MEARATGHPVALRLYEVEVRVTFERHRLVVFDVAEERVVAAIALSSEASGASIAGAARLLIGSERWFI